MALVKPAFLDTSVILAALIDFGAASRAPRALFDAIAARRLGRPRTAWHCCLELYSVATRLPEEFRLQPAQARELIESEVFGRLDVLDLSARDRPAFLRWASARSVVGGRLYDAHIAQIARISRSAVVITDNVRHFAGVAGELRVLSSEEAVRELRSTRVTPVPDNM